MIRMRIRFIEEFFMNAALNLRVPLTMESVRLRVVANEPIRVASSTYKK